MKKAEKDDLLEFARRHNENAQIVFIDPADLVFEENVKMNCFYCGKYGNNWRCPPNLPDIDFEKMFSEYDEGAFVGLSYEICDQKQYEEIRNDSSMSLHKLLLNLEKWMWNHNRSNAVSFGAGSCKLCRGGCGKEKCNNPYMARSPLEATGVNIVKSAAKYGIDIRFPTDRKLTRMGLIVWQNMEG